MTETQANRDCRSSLNDVRKSLRPSVDIVDGSEGIELIVELPGVDESSLNVELEGESLTVSAERSTTIPEGFQIGRCEFSPSGYRRSFKLGNAVDREKITADFKDGVLHVLLPRATKLGEQKIEIKKLH